MGYPIEAYAGRLGKTRTFFYNKQWNNKTYQEKKIEVYFIVEEEIIFTVTVYVFLGTLETSRKHSPVD